MEKVSVSRSNSPIKSTRKGEYKVQFSDASEYCKGRSNVSGKPPEVPRTSSSGSKPNVRPTGNASSSTGNLNTYNSSSGGARLYKTNNSSNTIKNDSFGSTTSLDRRREGSDKAPPVERTLQPISDAKRTQSLDRRRLERSLFESSGSLTTPTNRRKRDSYDSQGSERRVKINRSPYANSYNSNSHCSNSGERSKTLNRPKTSHPNLTSVERARNYNSSNNSTKPQTLVESNGLSDRTRHDGDWLQRIKRAASRSPHRKSTKTSISSGSSKEEEKENEKSEERLSRRGDERRLERDRGRSMRRENTTGRLLPDQCNNNHLEDVWSFEPGVMWSRTLNNRRIGYLLFSCSNLDIPRCDSFPAKYSMTYKFSPQADSKLIRLVLEAHGFTEVINSCNSFNMYWSSTHFNPNEIRNLQDWQKVNHFPRSSELTRKDRLYLNIKRMQRQFGVKLFDFIPTSFVLPAEYREFCETHLRERGTWIIKPVASSQGKGIYLISQIDQVPGDETSLISRYIESPLLVNGYKCDLRLYVAVTSLDPLLVYMFEEGLVRLATVKYQHKKNLWNPCIHLTNYSVNKFHSNYVHNQDPEVDNLGSKWSLSAFLHHLRGQGIDTATLMCSVEDVIIKSLFAAAYQMNTATSMFVPHARNCFELYGFDILIDEQLKPWVLEVNLSPSLNIDQPLDLKIKSSLLADLFSLAGLLICNPSTTRITSRPSIHRKLPNLRCSTESYERQTRSPASSASLEELRLVRQVMEENQRRGRWARIFPTPDSWSIYGGIQEYDSPLNLMLHTHLYPHVQRNTKLRVARCNSQSSSTGLASSLERLTCYERSLPKGLAFIKDKLGLGKQRDERRTPREAAELKQSLLEALENGLKLSKYQARMAFSVYLQHIQRRLMIGCDQENQTDLVYRFLRSATRTLHLPISVQSPSRTLPEEARAVVISKQLGDFIMAYTKETQVHYYPPPPPAAMPPSQQENAPVAGHDNSSFKHSTNSSAIDSTASNKSTLHVVLYNNANQSSNLKASDVTSVSLPSSSEQTYESYSTTLTVVPETNDKSVRFSDNLIGTTSASDTECRAMSSYPSTSSFNDITPSDVTDPLNPILLNRNDHHNADQTTDTDSSGLLQPISITSEVSSSCSGVKRNPAVASVNAAAALTVCGSVSCLLPSTVENHAVPPETVPCTSASTVATCVLLQHVPELHNTSTCCRNASLSCTITSSSYTDVDAQPMLVSSLINSDSSNSIVSNKNLSASSLTTSDLTASIMSASNDSFSSLSISGLSGSFLSGSVLSTSSLTNSFSSASIAMAESSSSTSAMEEDSPNLSANTFNIAVNSCSNTIIDVCKSSPGDGVITSTTSTVLTHNHEASNNQTTQKRFLKVGQKPNRNTSSSPPSVHQNFNSNNKSSSQASPSSAYSFKLARTSETNSNVMAEQPSVEASAASQTVLSECFRRDSYPLLSSPSLVACVSPLTKPNFMRVGGARRAAPVARSISFPSSNSPLQSSSKTFLTAKYRSTRSSGSLGSPSKITTPMSITSRSSSAADVKCTDPSISSVACAVACTESSNSCLTISLPCVAGSRSVTTGQSSTTVSSLFYATVSTYSANSCTSSTSTSSTSTNIHHRTSSTNVLDKTSINISTRKMKAFDSDKATCSDGESSGAAMASSSGSWQGMEEQEDDATAVSDAAAAATATRNTAAAADGGNTITMDLYRAFMSAARETDLEEVLALQTKLHNSAGMFLDSTRRSVTASRPHHHSTTASTRPRTPNASPHGSPRRGRRSPSMHGSQSKLTDGQQPVTSEPQAGNMRAATTGVDEGAADSSQERPVLTKSVSSDSAAAASTLSQATSAASKTTAGSSQSSSACCLFGNILKATLKGTNTSFSV